MLYCEFVTAFEVCFQTRIDLYPNVVKCHCSRFDRTIQYLLSSVNVT